MKIVNTDIMSHPLNWITVFLMVVFAGVLIHLVLSHVHFTTIQQQFTAVRSEGQ